MRRYLIGKRFDDKKEISTFFLSSYCSSLPKDEYTDSLPIYEVFKTDENLYMAKVTLPVTSKQKDAVQVLIR